MEDSYKTVLKTTPEESSPPSGRRRGRRGPPGPRVESCIVLLKPEHPEYFIRNEADVAIAVGYTIFPTIHLPKIDSKEEFDCDYLTAYTTKSRLKIVNLSTSPLTILSMPGNKIYNAKDPDNPKGKHTLKLGVSAIFYGMNNCWYITQ